MISKTIIRTISDWWRELYAMALSNLLWLLLSLLVITGPPATAAMLVLARETMMRRRVSPLDMLGHMRTYFWRSWLMFLLLMVGVIIAVVDVVFFLESIGGLFGLGAGATILYLLILWLQVNYFAWAMMVLRPDLTIGQTLRNGFVLSIRHPLFGLAMTLLILVLSIASLIITPLAALALVSFVSLLSVRGLATIVPELLEVEDRKRIEDLIEADKAVVLTAGKGRDDV